MKTKDDGIVGKQFNKYPPGNVMLRQGIHVDVIQYYIINYQFISIYY